MTVTYKPYIMALKKAIESPMAIWAGVLWGKDPRFSSLSPDRSTVEIKMIPTRDAVTPNNFRMENDSTRNIAQKTRVDALLVDVRIVTLATLVYSRHADAK
jgi:hypothetical protein